MKKFIVFAFVISLFAGGMQVSGACPRADINGDCKVNLEDFAIMASEWLDEGEPLPVLSGMTWVSIDDDGSGMKDEDGNPINEGGFAGEMSKYETTNAQYCEYLNSAKADGQITVYKNDVYAVSDTSHSERYFNIYPESSSYSQISYDGSTFIVRSRDGYDMSNHPVVEVSWYGATAFADYYGYRLPTEWEWQAVADHYGEFTYGCGTTINQSKANYYDGGFANPLNLSSYPYTTPVDYYPSYGYGMNDMAGNAWELTSTVSGSYRVLRGGGWLSSGYYCIVSYWATATRTAPSTA